MSTLLNAVHGGIIHQRRVARLAALITQEIPPGASVLDVGAGDGELASRLGALRPDLVITGVDVFVRPQTAIPVQVFDGTRLPFESASIDVVLCVDVLHHAGDAPQLLRECARVARKALIVKDHLREGVLADATLRLMDWVGNARHGVRLPYNYFARDEWDNLIRGIGVRVTRWEESLALYPRPLNWLFGRKLHVLMTLQPQLQPARVSL